MNVIMIIGITINSISNKNLKAGLPSPPLRSYLSLKSCPWLSLWRTIMPGGVAPLIIQYFLRILFLTNNNLVIRNCIQVHVSLKIWRMRGWIDQSMDGCCGVCANDSEVDTGAGSYPKRMIFFFYLDYYCSILLYAPDRCIRTMLQKL